METCNGFPVVRSLSQITESGAYWIFDGDVAPPHCDMIVFTRGIDSHDTYTRWKGSTMVESKLRQHSYGNPGEWISVMWTGESRANGKPPVNRDDDLRDEVAKAVFPALLTEYAVNEAVYGSFDMADAFIAERARRREGR